VLAVATGAVAAMFTLAAVGKGTSFSPWLALASALVPGARRARVFAVMVPLAELAIAAAVVGRPSLGLPAAAGALGLFAVGVALASRRLRGAPCNCFGAALPGTIGPRLAARNAGLAILCAGLAAWVNASAASPSVSRTLLSAAVIGGTLWAVARIRTGRSVPRVGSRARIDGLPLGRSAVVVMLAPGCGACEALSHELTGVGEDMRVDTVIPVIASGPPDARRAMAERIGPTARLDLNELFERWRITTVPFAIAIGRAGTVLASAPASPDGLDRLADALTAGRPHTLDRRRFVADAARAATGLLAAAGGLSVLTTSAWGARRRRARQAGTSCLESNVVRGTCSEFGDYVNNCGLWYDRYGNGRFQHSSGTLGYTHVWPDGPSDVKVSSTLLVEREYDDITATCPCPSRSKVYRGPGADTQCNAECPSGLACFGYQCKVQTKVCVMQRYRFTVGTPDLKITRLQWVPPKASFKKCQQLAAQQNQDTLAHEMHHQSDARSVINDENQKYQSWELTGCGPDERSARASLADQRDNLIRKIQSEAFRAEQERVAEYHEAVGQGSTIALDCRICGE
jgi:hypothetical protein